MYPERSWKALDFVCQLLWKGICLEIELGRLHVVYNCHDTSKIGWFMLILMHHSMLSKE